MHPAATTQVPLFVEEQRFRQWWLWLILLPSIGVVWYGFWQQIIRGEKFGNNPGPDWLLWILFLTVGLGLPWIFYSVALRFEVYQDTVVVRFVTPLFPLFRKTIHVESIERAEPCVYNPLWDYGGWGVRLSGKGWAYSVSGDRGVRLRLRGSKDVMLGSREPEQLAQAIQQALDARRRL